MLCLHHTASAILKICRFHTSTQRVGKTRVLGADNVHIAGIKPTTLLLLCHHTHIAPSPIFNIT